MTHTHRFLATLFSVVVLWPAIAGAQNTIPSPRAGLLSALSVARSGPMADLVAWAQGAPGSPAIATIATTINALAPPDRDAMMYWLDAHGRGPLHARGATDAQIGVPYYAIDYTLTSAQWPPSVAPLVVPTPVPVNTPTPAPRRHSSFGLLGALLPDLQIPIASSSSSSSQTTTTNIPNGTETNTTTESSGTSVSVGVNPWAIVGSMIDASTAHNAAPLPPSVPWRDLLFAASTLGSQESGITVTRGFAAVRNDGTEGLACISFANNAQKTANEVDVDIEILNTLGFIRRVAPLRLTGSFAPGQEVGGPANVEAVDSARANCVIDGENKLADMTDPFSGAQAVVYSIRRVLFADGTQWLQAGANPWN
jgi:hypothetical protein